MRTLISSALALMAITGTAHANWSYVGSAPDPNMQVYIDLDRVTSNGSEKTAWMLFDFAQTQTDQATGRYAHLSVIEQDIIECSNGTIQGSTQILYAGNMGAGSVVSTIPAPASIKGSPIVPGSMWDTARGKVCP